MWRRANSTRKSRPNDAGPAPTDSQLDRLAEENARLFERLGQVQQRFSGLARGAWRVQEDERRRLARELHDQLGQSLTALVHRLEQLPGDQAQACIELARQSLEDVRELSRLLRPPILDDLGLVPALNWLARRTHEASGLVVRVHAQAEHERLPDELETLLFRVAQEALNNTVKHARAGQSDIHLTRSGNRIELRIRDDGRGFDRAELDSATGERGIGLAGMQDRVTLFGGDLTISSAPGRGTAIAVTLRLESASGDRT